MKRLRMTLDIAMTVLMPLLMAYSLIGETFHEIIGTLIFILFILHHMLNRKWSGALFKGRYSPDRVFRTGINALLFVFMILQPLSGILMSKHLYTFLPSLPLSAQARSVHMLMAYWGYVLLSVHAGTHLTASLTKLRRNRRGAFPLLITALAAVSLYGAYAFVKRGFPEYLFAKTMFAFFDYSEPVLLFLLDYLAVMAACLMIGWLLLSGLNRIRVGKKNQRS